MQIKFQSANYEAAHFDKSCENCPIRYRAVCAHCDAEDLEKLEKTKYYRDFRAGQVIVWSGDDMDFVASIIEGVATLTQTLEDGRTQMVGLLMPSDFLGRPGRRIATFTVTAISDLQLCCFRRQPFEQMMRDNPRIPSRLLEMTLDELDAAREWLLVLGRKSAREKIASFLAILARRKAALANQQARGRIQLSLPLTREAIADYLGLTIETVSRQLTALKRDGLIEIEGKRGVVLTDFASLVLESGTDSDGGLIA
ncbi:transcriptional regulator FnrL [Paracoccus albus]|uniref:transcriptional regulator FnrL n=1 Tax=Paracoccus albus TaxID=3017784 RepID=UPI0022F09D98|nr:Crp/Fnr family transcriptional regulator [Paracoccus albus]WBU61409.1 Crp/Fnr family transcriptional regulator [Paracoccus albus]